MCEVQLSMMYDGATCGDLRINAIEIQSEAEVCFALWIASIAELFLFHPAY
jgi:hypothetical protein